MSAGLVIINYDLASSSNFWIYWVRHAACLNFCFLHNLIRGVRSWWTHMHRHFNRYNRELHMRIKNFFDWLYLSYSTPRPGIYHSFPHVQLLHRQSLCPRFILWKWTCDSPMGSRSRSKPRWLSWAVQYNVGRPLRIGWLLSYMILHFGTYLWCCPSIFELLHPASCEYNVFISVETRVSVVTMLY